jgi:hypothetical protein
MNFPDATIEPPLSPAPLGGLRRAPAPEEQVESPALSGPPPLPNLLLRMGLVTLPQLSAAMQEQAATGRELKDILAESGLISAADLAKVEELAQPAPAEPEPEPEPEAVAAPVAVEPLFQALPEPTIALDPQPAAPAALRLAVVAVLENGTRIEVGVYADEASARAMATHAMQTVRFATDDWPLLGGRYVRPESVVAIELSALL